MPEKRESKASAEMESAVGEKIEAGNKKLRFSVDRPFFSAADNLAGHYDQVSVSKRIKNSNKRTQAEEIKLENKDGGTEVVEVDLDRGDELTIEGFRGTQTERVRTFSNGDFPFLQVDTWEDAFADDDEKAGQDGNYPSFKKIDQKFYQKKSSVAQEGIEII